jgi:hypothetical protein
MARSGEGGVLAAKPKTERGALGFGLGCANPGAQYFVECVDGGVFFYKAVASGLEGAGGLGAYLPVKPKTGPRGCGFDLGCKVR